MTQSDLSRAIQHEPNTDWPSKVTVRLTWSMGGLHLSRTVEVEGDHFFGIGGYGAPMEGAALIGLIENMRKQGPPPLPPHKKGKSNAAKKR